ncbi:MAG: ATP-dependent helicase [Deltaproteobacteria bacterium HGW-Deltaproteobacteria-15]|nr:MAG: ATP-dependent helicase [Deltaproteobacteria bacterium HGW-Deltaproteobacteria-15]
MNRSNISTVRFHPLVSRWFLESVGKPTDLQEQAWPVIAKGENVLISAPTGSGKTLAAFLWAVDRLIRGEWPLGKVSVLYVSPLKALNNDIQRNLLTPLRELKRIFEEGKEPFPRIRVLTRSGDTPPSDRRRMQRHPPEILITTPESLNLILSSPIGRNILTSVRTAILDEIHAVVGTKRGTHLITAVDRLVPLSGEFQRIGLSATVKPLEIVAKFVGGLKSEGNLRYSPRQVSILHSSVRKRYRIRIRHPEAPTEGGDAFWLPFVDEVKAVITRNRSTLVFANSRRICEKITHLLNLGEEAPIAYAHHGSLSREIRAEVEQRLKAGELKAIVATNSLELGIDIGALDEVVLLQSPPTLSSAVQRIGRAGHKVGEISSATVLPTDPTDLIEAAVLASGVVNHDIERTRPVESPLDVLAQIIVSMTGTETWDMDRLFEQLRASYPYRNLSREQFDLVLNMLAGRFAATRLRELDPRISIDRMDNTVRARKGAMQSLYSSGGTIPDRGYFHLRHYQNNARIGELDEEFVWEAKIGQLFTLGTQNWKVERITHNDVFVMPADPRKSAPPFWKAEENLRDFHFSNRVAEFLEQVEARLDEPGFGDFLSRSFLLERTAADHLIRFLRRQKEATGCGLPHRHHLLVEFVNTGPGGYPGTQVVLHTLWGGRVNRPYAMALEAAWESRFGHRIELFPSDDCILLQLPHDVGSEELLSLVTAANVQRLLKDRLEGSGFFGARFRESAGRALLLTRRRINERMPLWLSRLRSQKLLDSVLPYEDFPILLEAWRTCLRDEFDLEALLQVLSELESGGIRWTEARTSHPSPMALNVTWPQINQYMYEDDRMRSGKISRLRRDLIRDAVFSPELRPAVSAEVISAFELKRKRLAKGYAPDTPQDLLDWVKERVLIPLSEWESLLAAVRGDHKVEPEALLSPIAPKLVRILPRKAAEPLVAPLETAPEILHSFYQGEEPTIETLASPSSDFHTRPVNQENQDELFASLLSNWLGFLGPTTPSFVRTTLGLDGTRLDAALEDLADSERVIAGRLVKDSPEEYICDAENFETLLRIARAEARPFFEPLAIERLQLFLASYNGLTRGQTGMEGLFLRIEQLSCHYAPAAAWETEIFPARLRPYDPAWLDAILQTGDLAWVGKGNRRTCFVFRDDLDLLKGKGERSVVETDGLFPDPGAKYDFSALLRLSGSRPSTLSERLWNEAWKGRITNDTFMALRRGVETGFKVDDFSFEKRRNRHAGVRSNFSRWKASLPFPGNWHRIVVPEQIETPIDKEERNKERARLLLGRYGILFRELLQNELPEFRWSAVFRALRLMELSGEVLTGYFFHGIPGPQFISHEAFRILQRPLTEDGIYWISAADPVSLCGIPLESLKGKLPRRMPGTHLVYRGSVLILISRQSGKKLSFHVPPDDPSIPTGLEFLRAMMNRKFQPIRRISVETINEKPAGTSPYLPVLRTLFDVSVDHRKVTLHSRI